MAYTKPQQRKKEESEKLRGERDWIKFIDLRFERWQVVQIKIVLATYFEIWRQRWQNSFHIKNKEFTTCLQPNNKD